MRGPQIRQMTTSRHSSFTPVTLSRLPKVVTSLTAEIIAITLGYRPLRNRQAVDWARSCALIATKNRTFYGVGALLARRAHGGLAKEIMLAGGLELEIGPLQTCNTGSWCK
jgi:hypothetical protein